MLLVCSTATANRFRCLTCRYTPSGTREARLRFRKPPRPIQSERAAVVGGEEDTSKQLFQRVFTEEDEILLLNGLFNFLKESGADGNGAINMVGFHERIKESIHTQITKAQLSDKIKRLKKRFHNNPGRVFKKDSQQKQVFKLSNKIWGVKESTVKSTNHLCLCACKFSLFGAVFEDGPALDVGVNGGGESRATILKNLMKYQITERMR
ncbi:hypothetical protein F3Y22_tig00018827pilonHSYRG00133 [Hibiscus syriacus]|uniref:Glabrous enhancer-binding protein-like DBD domain-containing protein n=1 Tax=Hibiscus syriacus TaxID=106335 RepID=A0A6A3BVH0_HIBSY|nr:hypothetical protein F3Y22_tig00018827pilonHSYRG00133 [Hibiscus syriacus]